MTSDQLVSSGMSDFEMESITSEAGQSAAKTSMGAMPFLSDSSAAPKQNSTSAVCAQTVQKIMPRFIF